MYLQFFTLSRDEYLVSRNETFVSRDENRVSRDETLVSRDENRVLREGGNLLLSGTVLLLLLLLFEVCICVTWAFVHVATSLFSRQLFQWVKFDSPEDFKDTGEKYMYSFSLYARKFHQNTNFMLFSWKVSHSPLAPVVPLVHVVRVESSLPRLEQVVSIGDDCPYPCNPFYFPVFSIMTTNQQKWPLLPFTWALLVSTSLLFGVPPLIVAAHLDGAEFL